MGGGAHLQRLFPVQKVRMMYFTGEPITAAEAHRLGAIEKVVPRAELREAALSIARTIAAKRSEEQTSELQSLMRISYAVFCLKKKKKKHNTHRLYNHNTNVQHTIDKT